MSGPCRAHNFQSINFEGIQFRQCAACGLAAFPKTGLVEKLGLMIIPAPENSGAGNCPKCQGALRPIKTQLKSAVSAVCDTCGIILASRENAERFTDALQEAQMPKGEKESSLLLKTLSVVGVSAAGLAGIYFLAFKISGDSFQSVMMACCVGLPTLYLINMAIHGMVPNVTRSMSGGEEHADIESLGPAAAEIWQEMKWWVLGAVVLLAIGFWALFQFSLPRAHLYRFVGWMQKPYSSYLDVVDSGDKVALGRMCDWYQKALKTNPRVFDSIDISNVEGICSSAGRTLPETLPE